MFRADALANGLHPGRDLQFKILRGDPVRGIGMVCPDKNPSQKTEIPRREDVCHELRVMGVILLDPLKGDAAKDPLKPRMTPQQLIDLPDEARHGFTVCNR